MIPFRSHVAVLPALLLAVLTLPATSAHAQGSASLYGQATDAEGHPLRDVVVRLVSDQTVHEGHVRRYTLIGDSLGKFGQEGLAPGAYLVMLFTDGKGTNVLRNVQLKAGGTQALDLTLERTARLTGASAMDDRHRMSLLTR